MVESSELCNARGKDGCWKCRASSRVSPTRSFATCSGPGASAISSTSGRAWASRRPRGLSASPREPARSGGTGAPGCPAATSGRSSTGILGGRGKTEGGGRPPSFPGGAHRDCRHAARRVLPAPDSREAGAEPLDDRTRGQKQRRPDRRAWPVPGPADELGQAQAPQARQDRLGPALRALVRGRLDARRPRRPPRAARRGRGLSIILGFGRAREVRAAGDELEVLSPARLLHLPRLPVDGPVEFAARRKRPFRSRALRRSLESVRTRPSPGLSSMRWRGMVITTTTCMYMLVNDGSIRTAMWVGLMA